uniref:Transcription factor domain-containing protein n=1 Tax=Bionectria ochroleuca TaxID=29856 RepID=A0A0B7KDD8_BIOOC
MADSARQLPRKLDHSTWGLIRITYLTDKFEFRYSTYDNCDSNGLHRGKPKRQLFWLKINDDTVESQTTGATKHRYALFSENERRHMAQRLLDSTLGYTPNELLNQLDHLDNLTPLTSDSTPVAAGPFGAFRVLDPPSAVDVSLGGFANGTVEPLLELEDTVEEDHPESWTDSTEGQQAFIDLPAMDMSQSFENLWNELATPILRETLGAPPIPGLVQSEPDQSFISTEASQSTSYTQLGVQSIRPAIFDAGCFPPNTFLLFGHYEENVISPDTSFFQQRKSPWQAILLPRGKQVLADLFLANVPSHAQLALFHGLLAISALHLSRICETGSDVYHHWLEAGIKLQATATKHLKIALRGEVEGKHRAKYKDLLIAVLSMAMSSAFRGPQNILAFLLDAERLIRLRGIPQKKRSFKVRLLHCTYTHLRIIMESIIPLQPHLDDEQPSLRELGRHSEYDGRSLRKFRLSRAALSTDVDPLENKEPELAFNDIHLEIQGHCDDSVYPDVLGVSESFMTLLSQTICLANERPRLERLALSNASLAGELLRHKQTLERNIWMWRPGTACSVSSTAADGDLDSTEIHSMALAMHQAILIYFYRRIHNVCPMMLQPMVSKTLDFLVPCMQGGSEERDFGASIGWTCFIAGSEAMLPYLQQRALRYLRVFDQNGSFWAPKGAVEVVQEIWRRRQSSGEWAISWPDVMLATPS